MSDSAFRRIANNIAEHFSSVWKLLSDTTNFLSRTPLFDQYEKMLRDWRYKLQHNPSNTDVIREVRQQIIALRKALREQGYDLTLGSRDLAVQGFRNDSSLQDGFVRLVLFISDTDVYYIYGQENHIELSHYLESQMQRSGTRGIRQRHFLWYLWHNNVLILSGSDTESKEDFELFRTFAEENKMFLLQRLRRLP
ncbi:hypothetical protein [Salinispira pacifica]